MRDEADHAATALSDEVRVRLYDEALDLARTGAWACELETERLTWTSGVHDIFGYPIGDSLRRASIVDRFVDESRPNMELARAEVIWSGRTVSRNAEIRTWHGERRWMRLLIKTDRGSGRRARIFGYNRTSPPTARQWRTCGGKPKPIRSLGSRIAPFSRRAIARLSARA